MFNTKYPTKSEVRRPKTEGGLAQPEALKYTGKAKELYVKEEFSILNVQHSTSNTQHSMFNTKYPTKSEVGRPETEGAGATGSF